MQLALPTHHVDFALDVFRVLTGDRPVENIAWSPFSATAALRLAAAGACGRTLAEITAVTGDPAATTGLIAEAEGADGVEAANSLWLDSTLEVRPQYEATRRAGEVCRVSFRDDAERARRDINGAVEEATHGWIRELLAPDHVDAETLAVIVNALYARLTWLPEFDRQHTRPRAFHTPSGPREVPTMTQRGSLAHAAADGWRLVTLPSCGIEEITIGEGRTATVVGPGELVFDVLLPDVAADEAARAAADRVPGRELLRRLHESAHHELVDLRLPRFGVASGMDLRPVLERLGVRALFSEAADLSGISPQPLRIDKVVHRAVLNVDEKGAEGAAATAMVAPIGARDDERPAPTPVEVHVDRPFLAMVRHQPTGAIYFMARITEP